VTVWSTPRRLALIARGLPETTEAVSEETKGPATSAPEQALAGFLGKVGLTKDQLEIRDLKGKPTYFAVVQKPGRAVKQVLAEAIPAIVRAFPWPKSQRWGAASISTESLRWVRPLSGIVAILGEDLVECEVGGIRSGYATLGHRFHHPGEITIGSAHDYADKLRACHVLVNHEERQEIVREKARSAASAAGLSLVEDEGLVIENAGLTEWPVPLLGRFDEDFLAVPPEVIQLTARVNQKYFVCEDAAGKLANAFVCTANIEASDGGEAIVAGNRKVLAARLSDARFFWDQDRKTPLSDHAKKLERITFHEKLGTVADKVERVAKLARWLVEEGIVKSSPSLLGEGARPNGGGGGMTPPSAADAAATSPSKLREELTLADQAELAARLCKADLVTEMVGEFPELQGVMGGYYARAEGLPDAVADAIRDHYKPVGQGDDVPTAPVTVAVSLADKLDTITSFFKVGLYPTGSKDPFALRRAMLGVINQIIETGVRMDFIKLRRPTDLDDGAAAWLFDFLDERLRSQQKAAGTRHDVFEAVFDNTGDADIVRLLARVHALQAFVATQDGTNLLAGYKRAANILKKEGYASPLPFRGGAEGGGSPTSAGFGASPHPNPSPEGEGLRTSIPQTGDEDPLENVDDPDMREVYAAQQADKQASAYTPEPAEAALRAALDEAAPRAAAAVEAEDFAGAMAALASLRAPIDAFFADVIVNDPDPEKRNARFALLDTFCVAVHNVADFSRIEG